MKKLNKYLTSKNATFNEQLKKMRNGFITDYDRDPSQKRAILGKARLEQTTREKKLKSQHVKKTAEQKAAVKQAEQNEIKRRGERGKEIAARISASKNLNMPAKEKLRKAIERNFKRKRVEQWMANDWQAKVNRRINEEAKKAAAKAKKEAEKAAAKAKKAAEKAAAKAQKEAKEAKATANAKAKEEAAKKAKATANAQKQAEEAKAKANATIKQSNSFKFGTKQERAEPARPRVNNNGNSGASTTTKKKRGFRVRGSSRVKLRKRSSATPKRTPSSRPSQVQRRVQGYEKMTREANANSRARELMRNDPAQFVK